MFKNFNTLFKKRYSSAILLIILMLILLSIPAAMVLFYRSEFENYEIIDETSPIMTAASPITIAPRPIFTSAAPWNCP